MVSTNSQVDGQMSQFKNKQGKIFRLSALVSSIALCDCVSVENIFSHNCGCRAGKAGWTYDRIDEHENSRGITMLSQSEGRELKDTM